MRTVDRFAFFFGIANLLLGGLSLFSPFVRPRRPRGIARILPMRQNRGIINKRPGQLFGMLGAVNPPQAAIHSALGALGLATRRFTTLSRPYMWITGLLFAALAVMGWTSFGLKPGIHKVNGIALDWRENIIHSLWGAGALLLAARPYLGQNGIQREMSQTLAEAGMGGAD